MSAIFCVCVILRLIHLQQGHYVKDDDDDDGGLLKFMFYMFDDRKRFGHLSLLSGHIMSLLSRRKNTYVSCHKCATFTVNIHKDIA